MKRKLIINYLQDMNIRHTDYSDNKCIIINMKKISPYRWMALHTDMYPMNSHDAMCLYEYRGHSSPSYHIVTIDEFIEKCIPYMPMMKL